MFDVLLGDQNSHDNDIGNHGNHDNNNGNTCLFIAHIRMIVSQETPWMCRCCYCCWCFFSLLLGHTKNRLAYNWLTWIIPKVNHFFCSFSRELFSVFSTKSYTLISLNTIVSRFEYIYIYKLITTHTKQTEQKYFHGLAPFKRKRTFIHKFCSQTGVCIHILWACNFCRCIQFIINTLKMSSISWLKPMQKIIVVDEQLQIHYKTRRDWRKSIETVAFPFRCWIIISSSLFDFTLFLMN